MLLLSSPNMGGHELKYITECIETGWVSSIGPFVDQFEKMTTEFTGAKYAVATSSGTAALHTCLVLLGVNHNDLVIAPNITFIATINSIKYTGASPILVDADKKSWQMDLDLLEEFLEQETEARDNVCYHKKSGKRIPVIMPVHVLGNIGDMDKLLALSERHHLSIVEDSTEALGSHYKGKHAGTFGLLGTFSYNGNKIITTGGGGMIITDNEKLAKRAKHLTTQAKSDTLEYFHDDTGYNYRLTNIAAAIGVAQMEQLPLFLKRKKEIMTFYKSVLEGKGDITFQEVDSNVTPNCWLPTIRTSGQKQILRSLNENKMQSRPLWVPMNQLPMFANEVFYTHQHISETLYKECLSIPCSTNIKEEELQAVVKNIKNTI